MYALRCKEYSAGSLSLFSYLSQLFVDSLEVTKDFSKLAFADLEEYFLTSVRTRSFRVIFKIHFDVKDGLFQSFFLLA
jgi:hypothetical protein